MKLTKTLWTKLITIGLGATMALGVGLTASKVAEEVHAAEAIYHSTSFSTTEGFSTSSTYNAPRTNQGTSPYLWDFLNGTVSTTNAITSPSAHLRGYAGAQTPSLETVFAVSNITKVIFSYKSDTNISVNLSYSTNNRASWSNVTNFARVSSATQVTYTINAGGLSGDTNLRWQMQNDGSATGSSAELIIDDITIYQLVGSTTPVSSVSLNKSTSSLYVGDTEQLTATVLPADASDKTVSWGTSNANVVTVTSGGLVTATGAGSATVTVTTTDGGKTATCSYTITAVVLNSISIKTPATTTSFSLGQGFTSAGLVLNAVYNNGTIEVSSGYEISGVNTDVLGAQTATVTYGGKTTSYSIDVTNQNANVGTSSALSDLIISEYIEGASYNKAIEIFNGTGSSINLSNYSLKLATNGAQTWGNSLTLSGILANNDVYVLAHKSAAADILAVTDYSEETASVINFNGDDSIGLFYGENLIDIFGSISGTDPGTSWVVPYYESGEATATTHDKTWVRHSSVTGPNSTSPFASTEWLVYDLGTHSYLGSHTSGGGDVTPAEQATAFANYVMTGIGNNAAGNCVVVKSELDTEYGYMHADAKTIFQTSSDSLFVNARARMTYLTNWVAAQSPAGVSATPDHATKNALIASAVIGILGLTTVSGFYFLKKKKETF